MTNDSQPEDLAKEGGVLTKDQTSFLKSNKLNVIFGGIAGLSIFGGFTYGMMMSSRVDPSLTKHIIQGQQKQPLDSHSKRPLPPPVGRFTDSAVWFACRALAKATLLTGLGIGTITLLYYSLSDSPPSFVHWGNKIRSWIPAALKHPLPPPSQSSPPITTLNDLLTHILSEKKSKDDDMQNLSSAASNETSSKH